MRSSYPENRLSPVMKIRPEALPDATFLCTKIFGWDYSGRITAA